MVFVPSYMGGVAPVFRVIVPPHELYPNAYPPDAPLRLVLTLSAPEHSTEKDTRFLFAPESYTQLSSLISTMHSGMTQSTVVFSEYSTVPSDRLDTSSITYVPA